MLKAKNNQHTMTTLPRLLAALMVVALAVTSLTACGSGGSGSSGSKTSNTFEGSGFTLQIAMDTDLDSDERFSTYVGSTHMKGGSTFWAGSVLSGKWLVDSTEYSDKLMVIMSYTGEITDDSAESLLGGASLKLDSETLQPILAWLGTSTIVLFYDAPADTSLSVAFASASGDSFTLVAR